MNKRARFIAIAIIAITAIGIFTVAINRMATIKEPHIDVERDRYPVVGIDLSAHNGDVDFEKVAAAGIKFVFLKASEGVDFRDPKFLENYQNARKAGIKVGAYHFFRFDRDGYKQGQNFLNAIDSLTFDLPLAIDVEEWGNPEDFSTGQIAEALRGMIFALEGSRHKVIIYTNKGGYHRFIRGQLEEMPVWVCSFTNPPMPTGEWTLWQHSHQSHVDGIDGYVDLNTFNGDSLSWEQWLSEIGQ